ncbi:MAG: hypothetical protein ACI9S8_002768 [Chlamydiales bacterium]|jgi:hypothetical protein
MQDRRGIIFALVLAAFSGCAREEGATPLRGQVVSQVSSDHQVNIFPIWTEEKGALKFFIRVNYYSEDWIFIQAGRTLMIRAGEEEIFLRSEVGSLDERKLLDGGYVSETADYFIGKIQMLKILSSETPSFILLGVSNNVERPLSESTLEKFRQFLEDYMH